LQKNQLTRHIQSWNARLYKQLARTLQAANIFLAVGQENKTRVRQYAHNPLVARAAVS